MAKQVRATRVRILCDSRLVINQVNEEFEAKEHRMIDYLKEVKLLQSQFKGVDIFQISQGSNSYVDSFATLVSLVNDSLTRIIAVKFSLFRAPATQKKLTGWVYILFWRMLRKEAFSRIS